ncbi:MAG: transcriptional regulator TrmB [Candidatus Peregrinibacteria bacterium GW2011_GWC2_39_14]|nr:MAG: transcriptional regulator TrmB [Candidatus Peregrinibacteria bacterium GW2011_GWC2_39_14]
MDLIKTLVNIGLSDKEAKIYLSLLEYGKALPSTLSRKTGVKRPTTYVVLEQLQKRGLVSRVKYGSLLYFRALNPYSLLNDQHEKYSALEFALPELLLLNSKYASTPQMTIYDGVEGIKKIMEDTLTSKTELLCWADVSLAVDTLLKDYYPTYVKKKVERKIWLRGIFSYDKKALEFKKNGEKELREVYLIPKDKFPFKNEINVYDDKVAIISHEDKIGVIIQSKNIADTQRSIFNFAFEYAKIVDEKMCSS